MSSEAAASRDEIAGLLAVTLSDWGSGPLASVRERCERLLSAHSDASLAELLERSRTTGADWGYNPPDPVARELSLDVMRHGLLPDSTLEGGESLESIHGTAVLVGNHLSFVDVNVLHYLMVDAGFPEVANRVTTLVGPKVFSLLIRRLASLCFGTVKLPQSASRASGEAVMSAREVARLSRHALTTAHERCLGGDHLLIFPEGSRSRSGALQRCLPAVARYLEVEGSVLVPWGHVGTEHLVPLGEDHIYPCTVHVRIGPPVPCALLLDACEGKRSLVMDVVGFLIAAQLPTGYRGFYDEGSDELARAREIADALAKR